MKTAHLLCISTMKSATFLYFISIFFEDKVHLSRNFLGYEVETSGETVNCQTVTDN